MKSRILKKSLAVFLSVVMLFSCMSVSLISASAAKTNGSAFTATLYENYSAPSYSSSSTKSNGGTIYIEEGETGYYQMMPLLDFYCSRCSESVYTFAPVQYLVTSSPISYGDSTVVGNTDFSITTSDASYTYVDYSGYDCLGLSFEGLKEGTTTVTVTYYVNFSVSYEVGRCGYCGQALTINSDSSWYKIVQTFTVVVGESTSTDSGNTDSGNTDSGNTDSGNTGSDNTGSDNTGSSVEYNKFVLNYDGNADDNSVSNIPGITTVTTPADFYNFIVTANIPSYVNDEYQFLGWSTDPYATEAEYVAGDSIIGSIDNPEITLYAIWSEEKDSAANFSVTYDRNGVNADIWPGVTTITTTALFYSYKVVTTIPTADGYKFLGWDTDKDAETGYYVGDDIIILTAENPTLVLYAIWEEETTDDSGDTDDSGNTGDQTQGDTCDCDGTCECVDCSCDNCTCDELGGGSGDDTQTQGDCACGDSCTCGDVCSCGDTCNCGGTVTTPDDSDCDCDDCTCGDNCQCTNGSDGCSCPDVSGGDDDVVVDGDDDDDDEYNSPCDCGNCQDTNADGYCDNCGYKIPTGHDYTNGGKCYFSWCWCICNATTWHGRMIGKMCIFFWKIFGTHKWCYCGRAHY